jgi:hypothetical protein
MRHCTSGSIEPLLLTLGFLKFSFPTERLFRVPISQSDSASRHSARRKLTDAGEKKRCPSESASPKKYEGPEKPGLHPFGTTAWDSFWKMASKKGRQHDLVTSVAKNDHE